MERFPQLKEVDASGLNTENCEEFLNEQIEKYGNDFEVAPMKSEDHKYINPLEEMVSMVGEDKEVIILKAEQK